MLIIITVKTGRVPLDFGNVMTGQNVFNHVVFVMGFITAWINQMKLTACARTGIAMSVGNVLQLTNA